MQCHLHLSKYLNTLKVEQTETWLRVDNDGFERDVDELASKLFEARRKQLPNHASGETEDCRRARKLHRPTSVSDLSLVGLSA